MIAIYICSAQYAYAICDMRHRSAGEKTGISPYVDVTLEKCVQSDHLHMYA